MFLPNLKHLQYLITLHEYQHFNRAAQASFISQSTLSNAINKLEEQLDCQLIERDHKAFLFTAQGEIVVEMARQLVIQAGELVTYAKQQGDPQKGNLRVGCIPTIAPFLLSTFVSAVREELPNISLYLVENSTENLLSQLAKGDIDTALLAFPIQAEGVMSKMIGKDPFYIAGNEVLVERFLASGNDYDVLPDESVFLLSQEHCLTEHAISACKLARPSKINPFKATSLATLTQMTAHHGGITFLPEMAIKQGLGSLQGLTIHPLGNNIARDIGMIWRPASKRRKLFEQIAQITQKLL